jgi:hypothetical protein
MLPLSLALALTLAWPLTLAVIACDMSVDLASFLQFVHAGQDHDLVWI